MKHLDLTVRGLGSGIDAWPVSGGVPLPPGALRAGTGLAMVDGCGRAVPLQSRVLAAWPDGSARWVLLDFVIPSRARGAQCFRLTWGKLARPGAVPDAIRVRRSPSPALRWGDWSIGVGEEALLRIGDRCLVDLVLTDSRGRRCRAVADSVKVEADGPIRSTLAVRGRFRSPAGTAGLSFRLRACVFAGVEAVRLEPMVIADGDRGVIQHIREVALEFRPAAASRHVRLGGSPDWSGGPGATRAVRLLQVDDRTYRLEGSAGRGSKAPGWAEWTDMRGSMALAVRDFWQQWPKALEYDGSRAVRVGLLPRFRAGAFDHMKPWHKHGYLFQGACYRVRAGQARRWQVWVGSQSGPALAALANRPPLPVVDPRHAIATGAWGPIVPAGTPGLRAYDRWADGLFDAYRRCIADQRDYGAMNWGDWFGERGVNWGNHEYDTPLQFLTQYARTGKPEYLYWGDTAARHLAEVDVVHHVNADLSRYFRQTVSDDLICEQYPARPGMVHEHSIGHVGGFCSVERVRRLYVSLGIGKSRKPYLCLDPYNLGHVFTEGMARCYFLTGDPWLRETVLTIGDNLARLVLDGKYPYFSGNSHSGRVNGWTLLAIAGAGSVERKPAYLRAMRRLADLALAEQDPNCGGWLYELPWGHCFCRTRKHVGEASFLTAIRLNGLACCHALTGDPRIPEAIRRGIDHMNRDTWGEREAGWRYTSCPSSPGGSRHGEQLLALARSVKLTHDPEQERILRRAWEALLGGMVRTGPSGRGVGKAYSSGMYGTAEVAGVVVQP